MEDQPSQTVDEYISSFPEKIRKILLQVRQVIKKTVPEAKEMVAYRMPAYKFNGKPLAYFAAFENHIGFYPLPKTIESFKSDLAKYKQGKGSVQFPLSEPMPIKLIEKMISLRRDEILRSS